jgi:hypothetical protein
MSMQALMVRAVLLALIGLGLSVAMLNRPAQIATTNTATVNVQKPRTIAAATPVVLATISVRPTLAELSAAENGPDSQMTPASATKSANRSRSASSSGGALPSLGLDMPYYSLGRSLPHVGKE